ncbi:MAG: hypothetical protein KCHDKBKB_00146 [Elusimicrobia bacterium]|nr:hypothetical protein [Elusimicrobiota bacterium]
MAHVEKETRFIGIKEKTRLNSAKPKASLIHILAGWVGAGYLYLVGKTSFVHEWDDSCFLEFRRKLKPAIYAFWHNAQVFLAYAHRSEGVHIIVSRSKDGEYIAQVMKRLGLNAVRGSSSRGGELALRELCDLSENGKQIGFTPDGPRGPVQTVHGGVVMAAQKSGVPIIPATFVSTRAIIFNSWDKFMMPLPFSRIVVAHGRPFYIPKDMVLEKAQTLVREALNKNVQEAEIVKRQLPSWFESFMGAVLYGFYTVLSLVFIPVVFIFSLFRFGGKRTLSFLTERLIPPVPISSGKKRVWLHAASVGEWQALRPVLRHLKKNPLLELILTVSTPEARQLVKREQPEIHVQLLPLDYPFVVSSWIKRLCPAMVGIVETELWPRLLINLKKNRIPVMLINGRLSDKSRSGWGLFRPLAERILSSFSVLFVRTELDGRRFVELGAPPQRIRVAGNTKIDNLTPRYPSQEAQQEKMRLRNEILGSSDGILVVASSTWAGEEKNLLSIFSKKTENRLRLIIAPRRLERISEVVRLLGGVPQSWSLWSKVKESHSWESDILLVDTLGDLKELTALGDIGFVGGSLVSHGGQNPLESAASGIPVLFGPSMENFHEEARDLKAVGAARQARHEEDVVNDIFELATDESLRLSMGAAGVHYIESKQGAALRAAEAMNELLQGVC